MRETSLSARASFAQERIFLDELIRFTNDVAIYNELTVLKLVMGSFSTARLERALRAVIDKNAALRTALVYTSSDGSVIQRIQQKQPTKFTGSDQHTFDNEEQE